MSNEVYVKRLVEEAKLPTKSTEWSAGADLCSTQSVVIPPGKWVAVPTGLSVEIPQDFEIQIRPRSGLAAKHGVTVLNAPGTIDSDYRGEIKVLLINHGTDDFYIAVGDRIAQAVLAPVSPACYLDAYRELSKTKRGDGGFGSTGR